MIGRKMSSAEMKIKGGGTVGDSGEVEESTDDHVRATLRAGRQ
jgi:hypothetical protein